MTEESSNSVRVGPMTVWWDAEKDVVTVEHDEGAELDLEIAQACSKAIKQLSGGRPSPVLVDFTPLKSISKETRDYFSKDPRHTEVYAAVAMVVNNALSRTLANFIISISKPIKPARVFDDRAKAIEWLVQFRS